MTTPIQTPQPYIDPKREITVLPSLLERQFRVWAKRSHIADLDDPQSFYDYRGYWLSAGGPNARRIRFGRDHFPDTFKQHGHPTFSSESQYSKGLGDGGTWSGNKFIPQEQVRFLMQVIRP